MIVAPWPPEWPSAPCPASFFPGQGDLILRSMENFAGRTQLKVDKYFSKSYISDELMDRPFSTAEVAKILGKTPRFVIDWTERGLFYADIQPASGPGSKRLFSRPSLLAAALVLALREKFDLPREVVGFVARWIRQEGYIWTWHGKEAKEKYDAETLRRMDEKHKKKIKTELVEARTFIYSFGEGDSFSMWFAPKTMRELVKEGEFHIDEGFEAMICVDLSHIKALVDKGIEQLP